MTGKGIKKRKEEAAACEKATDDGELMNVIIACIGGRPARLSVANTRLLFVVCSETERDGSSAGSPANS